LGLGEVVVLADVGAGGRVEVARLGEGRGEDGGGLGGHVGVAGEQADEGGGLGDLAARDGGRRVVGAVGGVLGRRLGGAGLDARPQRRVRAVGEGGVRGDGGDVVGAEE